MPWRSPERSSWHRSSLGTEPPSLPEATSSSRSTCSVWNTPPDFPRISPDGKRVVYVRNFMDIMKDRRRSNLWIINSDGTEHRPLTSGKYNDSSPRWSPDGMRLLYVSTSGGTPQLYCRWMDSGQTAILTDVTATPTNAAWSPDGTAIAFAMEVPEPAKPFVAPPEKPEGAEWSDPP